MQDIINISALDALVAKVAENEQKVVEQGQTMRDALQRIAMLETALVPVDPLPAPPKPPPIEVTDPLIPRPPANALHTRNFLPGADLGAKLAAANEAGGDRDVAIVIDESTGTFAVQVKLFPKRQIFLPPGKFTLVNPSDRSRYWSAPIIHNDHFELFGSGEDKTFIEEPFEGGFKLFASAGDELEIHGQTGVGVTSHVEMAHFTLLGTNLGLWRDENGAYDSGTSKFAALALGNAHHVWLHDIGARNISCLLIVMGGVCLEGNYANDWIVERIHSWGNASQVLSQVNGQNGIFRDCTIKDSGKLRANGDTFAGVSAEDAEPNHGMKRPNGSLVRGEPQDRIRNIKLQRILVDSTNSPFPHGNGIMIQNEVVTEDYGPILIEDCEVIGGANSFETSGNIANGYYIAGPLSKVTLRNCRATGVFQSLYRFENASGLTVENCSGLAKGVGGSETIEVMINNVTDSEFSGFKLKIDPLSPHAKMRMLEMGSSARNKFKNNDPGPILIPGNGSTSE